MFDVFEKREDLCCGEIAQTELGHGALLRGSDKPEK
jgi:hypothetical protein